QGKGFTKMDNLDSYPSSDSVSCIVSGSKAKRISDLQIRRLCILLVKGSGYSQGTTLDSLEVLHIVWFSLFFTIVVTTVRHKTKSVRDHRRTKY
ncbi:hypothetical protein PROFUN_16961, partial [Planoprotostelium fungivorum]